MSEKITFRELIESIAEETDKSKQFTHDFIKDFVEVINDGLEQEGNVNIAGFGKFKLRRVDERDGYNPQTEEKIKIPAHNKVVFKPYKNLRELVNAPYAHIEPKLIEKKDDAAEEGSTDPQDKDQTDFIPTGPPTSTEETKSDTNSEEEAPFDLDELDESRSSDAPFGDEVDDTEEEDNGDIVEFNADNAEDDEINKELNKLLEGSKKNDEETQRAEKDDTVDEDVAVEETLQQTEEPLDEEPIPSISSHKSPRERRSSFPTVIVAAAFILLLAAGGVWYFSLLPDESQPEMVSQQTISGTDNLAASTDQQNNQSADNQQDSQNEQSADNQDNQNPQQTAGQNQSQSQPSSSSATATSAGDSEGIEIQKGQTLWSLAEEKYGNPRLWPWIYGTNESVQNPDLILAGNSLSAPLPSGPGNRLNSADSVGVAKGYIATYRWYKDNNSEKAKNHLLGATIYHDDIHNIADVKIDKADLSYANRAR